MMILLLLPSAILVVSSWMKGKLRSCNALQKPHGNAHLMIDWEYPGKSSIVKTVLTLSAGIGIATSAVVVKKHAKLPGLAQVHHSQALSPIIVEQNGNVRFLERIPPATIASEIRLAAKRQDFDQLNTQLIKYNFYVIPENISQSKNL